jgi:hypothetical protein
MDGRGEPSRSALISKEDDNIAFGELKDKQNSMIDRRQNIDRTAYINCFVTHQE